MKISRKLITLGTAIVIGAALAYAFWPRPMMVDIGKVVRRPMIVTIAEEGRTRVHDTYVVSTPVAGRLLRVGIEPGDQVVAGKSVIGSMRPSNPTPLDVRDKAQARANVSAAKAALQLAGAERDRAIADKDLADIQLQRMQKLIISNSISRSVLDNAVREARITSAALRTADAAIAVRGAELASVRARLINFEDRTSEDGKLVPEIPIFAPTTGRVLRVMQESEAILPAGTAIMEIGNIENDLEVIVELLSSDAVQISPGDRAMITDWGGSSILSGVVERIDPWGFTKVSALGVEEQRVNTLIRFADSPEALRKLGHGFRVEVQIVIWEDKNAPVVPSSALFREGRDWAVFVVTDGTATLHRVGIGRSNGIEAQVTEGLGPGDLVILYPSSELTHGAKVSKREIK